MDELVFRAMVAGVLVGIALLPLAGLILLAWVLHRRLPSIEAFVLAIVMLAVYVVSLFPRLGATAAIIAVPETRFPLVLDLAMSQAAREKIVDLAIAGQLEPDRRSRRHHRA